VANLPGDDLDEIDFLLGYVPLQIQARHRVAIATKQELSSVIYFDMPNEVADRFISLYLEAKSFDEANDLAKELFFYTGDFKPDHVRRILAGAAKNAQVTGSFQIGSLINSLRARKTLPADEFEKLLNDNGLEEHSLAGSGHV
jgi:hypothetical protein